MSGRALLAAAIVLAFAGACAGSARGSGALRWSTPRIADPSLLERISCPSPSLCVGAASNGSLARSTNPTGGRDFWNIAPLSSQRDASVSGVSCPSVTLCVAVGAGVLTSTDPGGGIGTWKLNGRPGRLADVSCPSISLCVAVSDVGDVVVSTQPTAQAAWSDSYLPDPGGSLLRFVSVSCPSVSLCVAIDARGQSPRPPIRPAALTPGRW